MKFMEAGDKESCVGTRISPLSAQKVIVDGRIIQANTRLTPLPHGWPLTTSVEHTRLRVADIIQQFKKFPGLYE
jgi:hypothetical protein